MKCRLGLGGGSRNHGWLSGRTASSERSLGNRLRNSACKQEIVNAKRGRTAQAYLTKSTCYFVCYSRSHDAYSDTSYFTCYRDCYSVYSLLATLGLFYPFDC